MKKEIAIKLITPQDVKDFVQKASKVPEEVLLQGKTYIIDAKSICGVFSLDLSESVKLITDSEYVGYFDKWRV